MGFFIQDDWKVSRTLTVNLGMRFEFELPTTERYNRTVRGYDFATVNPIQARARAAYAASPIPEMSPSQFNTVGGLLFSNVGGVPRSLWDGDYNNWAPRIGFAWQAAPKTVIRGGYGIFYESIGAANIDVNQQGFSQRTTLNPSLDNGLTFIASISDPFPSGFIQPAGASGGLSTFLGRGPGFFAPDRRTGYMQRWSFGGQREFPWRMLAEVSYVGNRGTKLGVDRNDSVLPEQWWSTSPVRDQARIDYLTQNFPNPFRNLPEFAGSGLAGANISRANLLKDFPHFGSLSFADDIGYSWYHSLQARLEKRLEKGLTFGFTYTWSKFMEATERLNDFDMVPTEVISPQDRPHHFSMTFVYELPFAKRNK